MCEVWDKAIMPGFCMVFWKLDKNVCFMVTNVQFLNVLPNQVSDQLKTGQKSVWKLNVQISGVWFSDGYCTKL